MVAEMVPGEIETWRAYADLEPFDEVRADLRAGTIVQEIRNHRRPKGQPFAKLADCTLHFTPPKEKSKRAGADGLPPGVDQTSMSSFSQLAEVARAMKARRQRIEKARKAPQKRTPMRPRPKKAGTRG